MRYELDWVEAPVRLGVQYSARDYLPGYADRQRLGDDVVLAAASPVLRVPGRVVRGSPNGGSRQAESKTGAEDPTLDR